MNDAVSRRCSDSLVSGDRFRGCLLGLAIGDAVGIAVEFRGRGTFEPLTDMIGGGPFGLLPGQWTDDTSMALCLATSLVERGGFDPVDQMDRYCRWADTGYLSSTGACFDIGRTVASALRRYHHDGNPFAGSADRRCRVVRFGGRHRSDSVRQVPGQIGEEHSWFAAAVCGQVAGAYYGERGIPPRWLERLAFGPAIATLADRLHAKAGTGGA